MKNVHGKLVSWRGVAAGFLAGALIVHFFTTAYAEKADVYKQLNLFGDVLDRVRADYVEAPDEKKLIDSAVNGMLLSLDPHSSYMNSDQFQEMQVQTRGEFGGLGIEVTMENGVIKVVAPIDDTPAAKAGVLSNDLITHINKEQILGMTLNEAVEKMRGKVNTPVTLTILRKGRDEPLEITLVRDVIRVKSVKSNPEGAANDIGYIRVTSFTEQTQEGLEQAISALKKQIGPKLKGWIIDLRNNPGGLLDQARSVSDTFLARGEIVSTRGRHASDVQRLNAEPGGVLENGNVIVLINGGSASASEIVAGALQDNRRAKILGTRSFGKGSVQTIIPLENGGALRLTTARYYTPSGSSIQAKGIVPDFTVEEDLPKELKASQAYLEGEAGLRGHLKTEAGQEEKGSSSYVPPDKSKDRQLTAALAFLYGRDLAPFLKREDKGKPNSQKDAGKSSDKNMESTGKNSGKKIEGAPVKIPAQDR